MFLTSPTERYAPMHRCQGDFALLRALEELLASPELRLETLERVRDQGEAMVREVLVPEAVLVKQGLVARHRREPISRVDRQLRVVDQPCAICSQPTNPRRRLTMLSGEVVHYECRPDAHDVADTAARLLVESEGRTFCHSCLGSVLRISYDETRKVVGQLRTRPGFSLGTGNCSVCGKYRVILGTSGMQDLEGGDPLQR